MGSVSPVGGDLACACWSSAWRRGRAQKQSPQEPLSLNLSSAFCEPSTQGPPTPRSLAYAKGFLEELAILSLRPERPEVC